MTPRERLLHLLGGVALQRLRGRLRHRYETKKGDGPFTLNKISDQERQAIEGLLGRRVGAGATIRFDPALIDTVLCNAGLADSLRHALALLDGPLIDRQSERVHAMRQWEQVRAAAQAPQLSALLALTTGMGLLKRLCASEPDTALRMCERADLVLSTLPERVTTRSHLAAVVLGDAHALDSGKPLATLVLAALRHERWVAQNGPGRETDRELWALCGVLVNELARPALLFNVPCADQLGAILGEPTYMSLRALVRFPPRWAVGGVTVFVCEPNIVALAADRLDSGCAPLVCTDGMPAAAQCVLLAQLQEAGAVLRYHGDFDWAGIAIANNVIRQFDAAPWRMHVADYLAALHAAVPGRRRLEACATTAVWDPALAPAMCIEQQAVDEESVIEILLCDLKKSVAKADPPLL
ncbi:MAG: TIGR02679 family protein [Pseudomonadota bacterium]|nr:TIGR02679 family protein [Pseudomonadota bacterium]